MLVTHGVQARTRYNHRFGLAIDEMSDLPGKVLDHDGYLFGDSLLMSIYKRFEQQGGLGTVIMWISLDLFEEAPVGFVGGVVLQDIENEMLFYCLPHSIEAERFVLPICAACAKEFECLGFGRSGEREVAHIGQPSTLFHLFSNAILKVFPFVAFFYVGIVQASYCQHRLQAFGTLPALGRVGFVYDDGKAFSFQQLDLIHNHREFLQRRDDNGLPTFKSIFELAADETSFVCAHSRIRQQYLSGVLPRLSLPFATGTIRKNA